ncbi:MAG: IS66 family transposase [Planctomycetes bacterium]|nr:IS66 family transposase [Planctomycetota bacterium]
MDAISSNSCPGCEQLRQQVAALLERVAKLEAQLAAARKNSGNSSKPPSSDIVKPSQPTSGQKPKQKRKRGGQPGHPRHERPPFAPEDIDQTCDYSLSVCPDCGGKLTPGNEPPRVLQQVEVIATPLQVTEHRGLACYCRRCRKTHYAPLPEEVRRAGLIGPRLTAVVAFLKGGCHCSFTTIRKFLRDVLGVTISRGQLRKVCAKVADSLDAGYQQLLALLPEQDRLNVDETGHKEYKQRMWTWCFRASLFTLFKIDASRSSEVLLEVLGREFHGVLGCDYFSAYRKYMGDCSVQLQFCLAHLLRDVRFLAEHPHSRTQAYGRRVLQALRELFQVIHRREEYTASAFQVALQNAGDELWAQAVYRVPDTKQARNLAKRFRKHGEAYLRFITTPGIEPTNNLAEQAIRFVVIDRQITQGSRSEGGRRWLERIWTTMATCAQQGRSAFQFLVEAVREHFQGGSAPSLLPNTS